MPNVDDELDKATYAVEGGCPLEETPPQAVETHIPDLDDAREVDQALRVLATVAVRVARNRGEGR